MSFEDIRMIIMFQFRNIACLALFALLSSTLCAQFGNQWINYDQPYWRFPVVEDGIYRISYTDLVNAGFPVSSIDPRTIQVFGREKEQMIRVEGEEDGNFGPNDYIELFAEGNDGWLDYFMYTDPDLQTHAQLSLFNDTARYFLTYNSSIENLRMESFEATNFDDFTPRPYVLATQMVDHDDTYLLGKQDVNGISLPLYEEAEGWFSNRFPKGSAYHTDVPTSMAYTETDAPNAQVKAVSASASLAAGTLNHHLQVGWGQDFQLEWDDAYFGYRLNTVDFEIPAGSIGATTRVTHRSIDDLDVLTDWHAVNRVEITYAHQNTMEGELFFFALDESDGGEALINIGGFSGDSPLLFVAMDGYIQRVSASLNGDVVQAIVPFDLNNNYVELLLLDESNVNTTSSIVPVSESGNFINYAEVEADSAFVIITHPSLQSAANNYAAYRESANMETLVVDIEELYQQYAAGIWKHPLAMRRFCDHILQTWASRPSHLFILGKSIHEMDISGTSGARNNPNLYAQNLVPSWGWPTADLPITSGLGASITEAAIPTGRLAAKSQDEVLDYLNKVIEFEAQPPAEWMKNVMHFGGGGNQYEQDLFKYYLQLYEGLVTDTCFGGITHAFYKTTTDPIQFNLSDSIDNLISNGVSLMTFFGHASSTGFDQNIDSPSNYSNQGKYPLLIGNSCYTGNIHLSGSQSTSEEFVLAEQRGVIGFIAKADVGIPSYLNMFTENFYRQIFQESYGQSIGQCMVKAVQDFQTNQADMYRVNTALTFALHGDPAVRLNPHALPDYAIQPERVFFSPEDITAQVDSFEVNVVVTNLGKAVNNQVGVELIRHFPNGVDSSYTMDAEGIRFQDTLTFKLPTQGTQGVGINTFDVFVDYPALLVPELEEIANNLVQDEELLITSGDLIPVYPPEFAVVPSQNLTLQASTGYPFLEERIYRLQIDTTKAFGSPWMQEITINSTGGVLSWSPNLNLADSTVYFWRSSRESTEEEFNWSYSSFQHIEGKNGWGQAHHRQFERNRFNRLEYEPLEPGLEFETGEVSVKCFVYGDPGDNYEALGTRYQIDAEIMDYNGCGSDPAFIVAIIDHTTLEPWQSNYNGTNPDNDFGNLMDCANARNRPENYFIFRQNSASEMAGFIDLIENQIPDDHYVLIYTWQFVDYDSWDLAAPETYDVFEDLGATMIGSAQDSVPFVFFTQMGQLESNIEVYGNATNDYLEVEAPMEGTLGFGSMTSVRIGPATGWLSAHWDLASEMTDSTSFNLEGFFPAGSASEVGEFEEQPDDILNLNSLVTSGVAEMEFSTGLHDFTELSPANLNSWHVLHDPIPEAALNPAAHFVFENDTVAEGESVLLSIAIDNISPVDMDSLLVSYWIEDAQRTIHPIEYPRQAPLLSGTSLRDSLWIETLGLGGENTLWIEVNPLVGNSFDQLEAYHFNNIAQLRFVVVEDKINPILDVTFDGIHILDGEIVSAKPFVSISLDDENEYFILEEEADTSNFKLFLSTPEFEKRPIYFSLPEVLWVPATGPTNKSHVEYTPSFELDGEYELIVQATDKSGNDAGAIDYAINFEVFGKPTITEVLNYPNPFSTRTQFVFTLTGTTPPDEVSIQIMTVTGRIVREIDAIELGPLKIGRNFTDFWWDGTDQFGDKLANGVYLYRVKARLDGQDVEMRSTEASGYFKEGIGKMYLLR